jgi:L-arabinose transport system ATP-binding protein
LQEVTPLLEFRRVGKRFGVVHALSEVTLPIRAGEILALVGENGAGKSTLTRIMEGVHQPDTGEVVIDGAPVLLRAPAEAHAAGIRVIHQEPDIFPDLSVAENLFVGDLRRVAGIFLDRTDLAVRTRDLLTRFGLQHTLSPWTLAGALSAAHRQLLEIMRALRAGVRLLALDEPTSSLSDDEAQLLFSVVRQLRKEGVALVYISHRMPEIRALADRVAILRDGRLVACSPVGELSEADIVHLMVGRPVSTLFDRSPASIGKVALETRGLTTARVRDVSMSIRAGEVVGLGGLMGAGRSELALAIFGQDRLTAGSVIVDGAEIRLRSPADAIAAGIGLAPEERKSQALLLMRSVAENVTLCVPDRISRFGFLRRAAVLLVAGEQVERMRVKTSSLDELVSNLSGGNQQKVVLARWLARAPRVLILDEPTRGIDVGAKAEIYRLIAQLAASGIAILVISSELPELIGLSDRILVMAAGGIVGEVPRAEATEQRVLNLAMRENLSQEAA